MSKYTFTRTSVLFASALLLSVASIHAAETKEHASHHTAAATPDLALTNLRVQMDSIDKDLAANKLNRVHHFAEAINEAVKGLDAQSSLDDTKKKRVSGYIKNIAKLTDNMHDAADEKKLEETRTWNKKLKVQVHLLENQFTGTKN